MGSSYDKALAMYEGAMESIIDKVEAAKKSLEELSKELYDVDLSEDEWRKLDKLLNKALVNLDEI